MNSALTQLKKSCGIWWTLRGLLLIPILSACGTNIDGTRAACAIFERPSWSTRDTPETQAWAERYAVRWERLCDLP